MTDALTGIANRKHFDQALRAAATEAMEGGTPLSLAIIDIDHFKKFNDTYGHVMGDHALRLVARTLTDCIHRRDTAARFGGEEFAIVMPGTSGPAAAVLAERIRVSLASKRVIKRLTNETLGTITLSLGVATYEPGEPLRRLIQRADSALYLAKRTGRNRAVSNPGTGAPDRVLSGSTDG
jgi:diguanylate cyclase